MKFIGNSWKFLSHGWEEISKIILYLVLSQITTLASKNTTLNMTEQEVASILAEMGEVEDDFKQCEEFMTEGMFKQCEDLMNGLTGDYDITETVEVISSSSSSSTVAELKSRFTVPPAPSPLRFIHELTPDEIKKFACFFPGGTPTMP